MFIQIDDVSSKISGDDSEFQMKEINVQELESMSGRSKGSMNVIVE